MRNTRILLLALAVSLCTLAATAANPLTGSALVKKVRKAAGIEVVYEHSYKGHVSPARTAMTVVGSEVAIERRMPEQPNAAAAEADAQKRLKSADYQDWNTHVSRRLATLPDGRVINTAADFKAGEGYVKVLDDDTVLGLPCHVWRFNVNSNTIDVWWTEALEGYRGTPQLLNSCAPDGLVLKVVRNGESVQQAVSVQPLATAASPVPSTWGETMEPYMYTYECNHCYDIDVRIFDQQSVCFNGDKLPDPKTLVPGEQYSAGGGTIILKRVTLPKGVRDREVFATLTQYSVGDAYDRTGSVFVIPTSKAKSFLDAMHNLDAMPGFKQGDDFYPALVSTADYDVPVELMRFFTGFGVRQFNHNQVPGQTWVDSVTYRMNVTPLAETLEGDVWIGAYIGNWDAKGHKISLRLTYYGADPDDVVGERHVQPLFNTVNLMEQDGQPYPIFMLDGNLRAPFHLDRPAKKACLYYITTGHGGWGGGDEFNQKINTISLDGQKVIDFIPWRDDCATYRNNSPCSGNFSNGLSSSDLSRSNWCPGTVTNPEYIYLGDLTAGDHVITVDIPQGAPEGGSNSYWCISGSLLYFE